MLDNKAKVYVFDLDGTLVRNVAFRKTIYTLPRILGLDVDPDAFYDEFIRTYYSTVASGELSRAFDWEFISEKTISRLGGRYRFGVFTDYFVRYIEDGHTDLIPHALEVLRTLRRLGATIVILTNGKRIYQEKVLLRTGLYPFVDMLLTLDDLPKPKPHPEAFSVLKKIFKDKEICFVGDHPLFDIYAAANSCIPNIFWFTEEFRSGEYRLSDIFKFIENVAKTKYGWRIVPTEDALRKRIYVINRLSEILKSVALGD